MADPPYLILFRGLMLLLFLRTFFESLTVEFVLVMREEVIVVAPGVTESTKRFDYHIEAECTGPCQMVSSFISRLLSEKPTHLSDRDKGSYDTGLGNVTVNTERFIGDADRQDGFGMASTDYVQGGNPIIDFDYGPFNAEFMANDIGTGVPVPKVIPGKGDDDAGAEVHVHQGKLETDNGTQLHMTYAEASEANAPPTLLADVHLYTVGAQARQAELEDEDSDGTELDMAYIQALNTDGQAVKFVMPQTVLADVCRDNEEYVVVQRNELEKQVDDTVIEVSSFSDAATTTSNTDLRSRNSTDNNPDILPVALKAAPFTLSIAVVITAPTAFVHRVDQARLLIRRTPKGLFQVLFGSTIAFIIIRRLPSPVLQSLVGLYQLLQYTLFKVFSITIAPLFRFGLAAYRAEMIIAALFFVFMPIQESVVAIVALFGLGTIRLFMLRAFTDYDHKRKGQEDIPLVAAGTLRGCAQENPS